MRNSLLAVIFLFTTLTCAMSCSLDGINNKMGINKSSQTLKEAKEKGLVRFEFDVDKPTFLLENFMVFKIKNAWVENRREYGHVDEQASFAKDSAFHFIIEADYDDDPLFSNYYLGGIHLGSPIFIPYSGQDTINLLLQKDTSSVVLSDMITIDTITFIKHK